LNQKCFGFQTQNNLTNVGLIIEHEMFASCVV
jgi:hypothetical protein